MIAIRWIGEHSNKVRAAIWSALLLALALHYLTLDDTQMGVIGLALSNFLDLFVETNTVSKVRVGERIDEKVAQITATGMGAGLVVLLAATLSLSACAANMPPNLTPQATAAFKGTQAVRALDLIRDTAIAANAEVPPLVSEATTRKIVQYHQSSVKVIQAAPDGWKPTVNTGLDELLTNLSPSEKAMLSPYVVLLQSILREVAK